MSEPNEYGRSKSMDARLRAQGKPESIVTAEQVIDAINGAVDARLWATGDRSEFVRRVTDHLNALLIPIIAERERLAREQVNAIWREATMRVLNNPVLSIELNSFIESYWVNLKRIAELEAAAPKVSKPPRPKFRSLPDEKEI